MDGWVVIGTKLDNKQLDKDLKDTEKKLQQAQKEGNELMKQKASYEAETKDIREYYAQQRKIATSQEQINNLREIESIETSKIREKYGDIENKIKNNIKQQETLTQKAKKLRQNLDTRKILDDVSSKTETIIKKVGRWLLAIFSIKSVTSLLTRASATLSSYNEQYASDLEYIRFALAQALAPILQFIVRLAYRLMGTINAITQALFGFNLFASASADNFLSIKNSANAIKKSLAGFDEANVLGGDTGGGGMVAPSQDLSKGLGDIETPEWLKWIQEHGKELILIIGGIVLAFVGLELILGALGLGDISLGFNSLFKALGKSVEIIATLGGLALVIKEITGLVEVLSNSSLSIGEVLIGLGGILAEVILAMAVIVSLAQTLAVNPMALVGVLAVVASIVVILKVLKQTLPTILDALGKFINTIAPSVIALVRTIGDAIKDIIYALGTVLPPIINSVGNLFNTILNGIANIIKTVGDVIVNIIREVGNLFQSIANTILDFISRLGWAIDDFVDGVISAVTKLINFIISGIEYLVNTVVIGGVNSIIKAINTLGDFIGISIPTVRQWSLPRFVPKLAVGGIVNMPGKGVPVGGAIAGESGAEGVLPLTDPQTMERIGKEIGKWVTINVDMKNYMNGRLIGRELQNIQNSLDFAYNR